MKGQSFKQRLDEAELRYELDENGAGTIYGEYGAKVEIAPNGKMEYNSDAFRLSGRVGELRDKANGSVDTVRAFMDVDVINTLRFPEIQKRKECKILIEYGDDTPYLFFSAFWKLLELCLNGAINDNRLRDEIFDFLEEMALCDDCDIVNLVAIEMLEPLFGLEYDVYNKVVKRYLRPKTLQLHQQQLPFFQVPRPNKV